MPVDCKESAGFLMVNETEGLKKFNMVINGYEYYMRI